VATNAVGIMNVNGCSSFGLVGGVFEESAAVSPVNCPLFYVNASVLTLKDCVFLNITYTKGPGTILFFTENYITSKTLEINNCTFTNIVIIASTANPEAHGLIYIPYLEASTQNLLIQGSHFENCTDDGTIYWGASGEVNIRSSAFSKCFTLKDGGAICVASGSKLLLFDDLFIDCNATGKGGAVFALVSSFEMKYCIYRNCSVEDTGGAIYLSGQPISVKANYSYFENSLASGNNGAKDLYISEVPVDNLNSFLKVRSSTREPNTVYFGTDVITGLFLPYLDYKNELYISANEEDPLAMRDVEWFVFCLF
jgi:hypothetical protein